MIYVTVKEIRVKIYFNEFNLITEIVSIHKTMR